MVNKEIIQQAKLFLYDLNNARHEYSFSKTENWVFTQSTIKQKQALEAHYYPVFVAKCAAADLPGLTQLVIEGQTEKDEKSQSSTSADSSNEHVYLVAHCATKQIR